MTLLLPDGSPYVPSPVEPKAATGVGVGFFGPSTINLMDLTKTPQRLMARAQHAYRSHPWIGAAEAVVTRKVCGLPFHFEDAEGEEYAPDDPKLDVIEALLGNLSMGGRKLSWFDFESLLSRHIGLCGMGYVYLDQTEAVGGTPLGLVYVNPARVWPAEDKQGNLTGWVLDAKDTSGRGGTPYSVEELIPFYLDQPDEGHIGIGLYERLILKAQVAQLSDQHAAYVLGTGGRIAGIVSPKEGVIPDERFKVIVNEFRNVNEAPDAAKRTTVMQNPTVFVATGANPTELNLEGLTKLTRDDILAVWGVPQSQASIPSPAGLNSGDTKGWDEAILMQGVVHDRVMTIRETLQARLWDRYAKLGLTFTMVIDEPEFDDQTPAYERAEKARILPLTRNQRLSIIGQDPLPDYDASGAPLGTAIDLPTGLVQVAEGPDRDGKLATREAKIDSSVSELQVKVDAAGALIKAGFLPASALQEVGLNPITHLGLLPVTLQAPVTQAADQPVQAKAGPLGGLRARVTEDWTSRLKTSVGEALRDQLAAILATVRGSSTEAMKRHRNDPDHWWNAKREDARMLAALQPAEEGIASQVVARVTKTLPKPEGKATPFAEDVQRIILSRAGSRIKNINETTRQAVVRSILEGFELGESPSQVAERISASAAFNEARAELIARTETMLAYNDAALTSYQEYGVERVTAIDGDQDEECAARDGQEFTVEEAMSIEDHPNGTLDWAPVKAERGIDIRLDTSDFTATMRDLITALSTPKEIIRNDEGRIVGVR